MRCSVVAQRPQPAAQRSARWLRAMRPMPLLPVALLLAAATASGGASLPLAQLVPAAAPPPIDVIRALDAKFCADYNAGNAGAVASNYNPGADIIVPNASAIVKGADAAAYFAAQMAAGVANLKLTPLTVAPDSTTLYHEIGNATHSLNPGGGLYYVRWFFAGSI